MTDRKNLAYHKRVNPARPNFLGPLLCEFLSQDETAAARKSHPRVIVVPDVGNPMAGRALNQARHKIKVKTKSSAPRPRRYHHEGRQPGRLMFADTAFREGTDIERILLLPQEVGLPASEMGSCSGKIVRTERVCGKHGIAAKIERFQPLSKVSPSDSDCAPWGVLADSASPASIASARCKSYDAINRKRFY